MAEDKNEKIEKKIWTETERLELTEQLDAELDKYINGLKKKPYKEGWLEDHWQEEMEKHPFFMKKSPEPGEKLSPLLEGLQQLKYDENENTPEELANNYKEDGNFNYKYKKYRLAILSYTEGIKIKCQDNDLVAQLYNNRAAAHFMLKNYRSSLNDSKYALKLKPKYEKALSRAVDCCLQLKDYDQCIQLCNEFLDEFPTNKTILNIRTQAITEKKRFERDTRMKQMQKRKLEKEEEKLMQIIHSRNINVELSEGKQKLDLKDLEPNIPQIVQSRVHLCRDNKLIWPVLILYPETCQTDFIQEFPEDIPFINQLETLFEEPPEWDTERRYIPQHLNVYFEEKKKKNSVHKVDVYKTLGEILADKRFVVRGGTPAFLLLVASSEAEKRFLANY